MDKEKIRSPGHLLREVLGTIHQDLLIDAFPGKQKYCDFSWAILRKHGLFSGIDNQLRVPLIPYSTIVHLECMINTTDQ